MKSHIVLAVSALSLALGISSALAQAQSSQSQTTGNQPAAPSHEPAQEATTAARTGSNAPVDPSKVGKQEAAPSQTPASQATTAETKQKP